VKDVFIIFIFLKKTTVLQSAIDPSKLELTTSDEEKVTAIKKEAHGKFLQVHVVAFFLTTTYGICL